MKYPTGEYRKLLCLYQQLQQPEPVIYSRSLRERHLLFLSNTPKLILYFTQQGKRYWLVNERDCFGLKPFRYPAGSPGRFFTRALKNTLSVKLHRVLDNNHQAVCLFRQALIREVAWVFDELVTRFNQQSHSTFMLNRSVVVDSGMLTRPTHIGVLGHVPEECWVKIALRQSGLGHMVIDMNLFYYPLPFVRYRVSSQLEQHQMSGHLSDGLRLSLRTQLCQQVPGLVERFFHHQ